MILVSMFYSETLLDFTSDLFDDSMEMQQV